MGKRPTEDEQSDRDFALNLDGSAQARQYWSDKMLAVQPLEQLAGSLWDADFVAGRVKLRDLWLVLAVFETQERIYLSGNQETCQSRWFDRMAPRKQNSRLSRRYGNPGYVSRTVDKLTHFLAYTEGFNGYLWTTDLGDALVQHLRKRHPELAAGPVQNSWRELRVEGLGHLPAPLWKDFTHWGSNEQQQPTL